MNISENQYSYLIKIPPNADNFHGKLEAVKKLPGRVYLDRERLWAIPKKNYPSMNVLMEAVRNILRNGHAKTQPEVFNVDPLPELTIDIPLKKEMYHFQKQGVAYAMQKGSVLNGDQQGLGKTIEAIATILALDLFPCLVVTKKTLILNWEKEWNDWTDKQVMKFVDTKKNTWPFFFNTRIADVGIVNYDALNKYFVQKIEIPRDPRTGKQEQFRVKHIHFKETIKIFRSIIFDESHYVKDGNTKRTKFCIGLTRHLTDKGVFLLTGTPVLNDGMELYTQLTIMNRAHAFGSYSQFKVEYGGKNNNDNLKRLNYLMHKHCYFRRTKQEVRLDMPPKTRQVILCDITNRDEYNLAEQQFVRYLKEKLQLSQGQIDRKLRGEALVQMMLLKKIAAHGKLDTIQEYVESLTAQGEKVVMFSFHKDIQDKIVQMHSSGVQLGALPIDVKERNKKLFQQNDAVMLISCSISADSEGHTLNAASNLGMAELPWHYGKAEQCEDRIHRITNDMPANISYFLADNTIDRYIYDIIMDKKEMHDTITGTEDELETKVVDKIISIFNQR